MNYLKLIKQVLLLLIVLVHVLLASLNILELIKLNGGFLRIASLIVISVAICFFTYGSVRKLSNERLPIARFIRTMVWGIIGVEVVLMLNYYFAIGVHEWFRGYPLNEIYIRPFSSFVSLICIALAASEVILVLVNKASKLKSTSSILALSMCAFPFALAGYAGLYLAGQSIVVHNNSFIAEQFILVELTRQGCESEVLRMDERSVMREDGTEYVEFIPEHREPCFVETDKYSDDGWTRIYQVDLTKDFKVTSGIGGVFRLPDKAGHQKLF